MTQIAVIPMSCSIEAATKVVDDLNDSFHIRKDPVRARLAGVTRLLIIVSTTREVDVKSSQFATTTCLVYRTIYESLCRHVGWDSGL